MPTTPAFGDNVRIRKTPDTEQLGVAGLVGNVHGVTKPSATGVEVIGQLAEDVALHVFFEERNAGLWFALDLVEFVDHAPGSEIRVDGVPKRWIRTESGAWREERVPEARRPWWKFW